MEVLQLFFHFTKPFIMETISFSVGVDVAKETFVCYIEGLFANRTTKRVNRRKFNNNKTGIKQFLKWLVKNCKTISLIHVTMEATGRYHEPLAYALFDAKLRCSVVLPNKIKSFAYSLNEYSKTDPIDARIIASYTSMHNPAAWTPANKSMRQLRELTREREDVMKSRTQAKNRIAALRVGHLPPDKTMKRLGAQIKLLDTQIKAIDTDMERLKAKDAQLAESVDLLVSIPHIGAITAYAIIAETNAFNLFENRNQLIKYAGLDIVERQSGSSIFGKSKISRRGNSHLRSAPYPGALSVKRSQSVFQQTYWRSINNGKEKKQAHTAVVRQLLQVAYGVHKSGIPYNEDIHRLRLRKSVDELKGSSTVASLAY